MIKKYGTNGTHLQQMEAARAKLSLPRIVPDPGEPAFVPTPKTEPAAAAPAEAVVTEAVVTEAVAEAVAEPAAEAPAEEPKAE